ncbi:MAG: hypothetical protein U0667_08850 [Chloroflexota bacterium]
MAQRIEPGDVVVIRYEGPVGGGHAGDARGHRRARGRGPRRLRGPAHGWSVQRRHPRDLMIGHVAPEAAHGGPSRSCARATRSPSTSMRAVWTSRWTRPS